MWEKVLRWLGLSTQAKPEPQVETTSPPSLAVNGGSNNLQVGHAAGDVVSQVSHHSHNHTHTHVTVIQASANESQIRRPTTAEQSATLRRLDQLRDRIPILDFMEQKFDTRMVIHLKSEQLNLLNRYLDAVMRDPRNIRASGTKRTSREKASLPRTSVR